MDHHSSTNSSKFREWVTKLINTHQDTTMHLPLVRIKQIGVMPGDQEEIQNRIDSLKEQLTVERVELQKSRTIGKWLPEEKLVKIIRQAGTKVLSFGHQNAEGKFLTPFEALFLLETNRSEILEGDVPWTMNKAYRMILLTNEDILKYKGYRKYALLGCSISAPNNMLEEVRHKNKKLKTTHKSSASIAANEHPETLGPSNVRTFNDIFEDMRAAGPRRKEFVERGAATEGFITTDQFNNRNFGDAASVLCFTSSETSTLRIQQIDIPNLSPAKES